MFARAKSIRKEIICILSSDNDVHITINVHLGWNKYKYYNWQQKIGFFKYNWFIDIYREIFFLKIVCFLDEFIISNFIQ